MISKKTAYKLSKSQVVTPIAIVKLVWQITHKYRNKVDNVLDLGAGDGRFSVGGNYCHYDGIEIDNKRIVAATPKRNAKMHVMCAFEYDRSGYSLCIGNPPYVRHHDLNSIWREKITNRLSSTMGITINMKGNLYIYFMMLALIKTTRNGLVSMLVPYEWVSRPSAGPLREFIRKNRWHVDVYRFKEDIFDSVLTTSSISVIDKRNKDDSWQYFNIDCNGKIASVANMTNSSKRLLEYEKRGNIWALRGMSPGTQDVFTLSEGERIHAGLAKEDVLPCVTTLRDIPADLTRLSEATFRKRFIDTGAKCWLIRSNEEPSEELKAYLDSIPEAMRDTSTCNNRDVWYKFELHPIPKLLVATGFTAFGPKVLLNDIGAYAVGSVCGVHTKLKKINSIHLRKFLTSIDFEKRIVAHSGALKKIEIKQLNTVLNRFCDRFMHA